MTAHIALPALHDGGTVPATLSSHVLTELLRGELGYEGVIISDDMSMQAIADSYGVAESAVLAVQAGVDIVLLTGAPEDQIAIQQALLAAARAGTLSEARIDASVRRILCLKLQYGLFDAPSPSASASIGGADSAQQMAVIADQAVTLVQNASDFLPISRTSAGRVLVVSPSVLPPNQDGTALGDALRRRGVDCRELVVDLNNVQSRETVYAQALQSASAYDWFLVGTWYAVVWQASLVQALCLQGKPVVVVAFGTPYDLTHFPKVTSYLAAYGNAAVNVEAVAKVMFGETIPVGLLPVTIPGLFPYGWRAEPLPRYPKEAPPSRKPRGSQNLSRILV